MTQQRKYSRLPFKTRSSLMFQGDFNRIPTELIDISFKGALVEAPPREGEVALGTPVALRIHLEDSDIFIEMKTEAVHMEKERLGLKCLSIDMESMTHLRRLLELNLGDPGLLEREVIQLG